MNSSPPTNEPPTDPKYELLYHPTIPGRGEYIRLAFEAASTPYADPANTEEDGYAKVLDAVSFTTGDELGNPPIFALPALRVHNALDPRDDGLLISQTPNILLFLGPRLGLVPDDEAGQLYVNSLALTALDLSNEAHDVHHPIDNGLYYEDQKQESLKRATMFSQRLDKFFKFFEGCLEGNKSRGGGGKYLVGPKLTYADTTLWQVVDG